MKQFGMLIKVLISYSYKGKQHINSPNSMIFPLLLIVGMVIAI